MKVEISELRQRLNNISMMQLGKNSFIGTVRKFMEMDTLSAPLLPEIIDHIHHFHKRYRLLAFREDEGKRVQQQA